MPARQVTTKVTWNKTRVSGNVKSTRVWRRPKFRKSTATHSSKSPTRRGR